MKLVSQVLAFGMLFAAAAPFASAATISSTGGTITLDGTNGTPPSTLTFEAASGLTTRGSGTYFLQNLVLTSGYDGAGGPIPFSFDDPFLVNGVTGTYHITGTFNVSPTTDPDTLTLDRGPVVNIGGQSLQLQLLSFNDNPPFPGGINDTETANFLVTLAPVSATPEPSSLALLGTGLLGAVGAARRRFKL